LNDTATDFPGHRYGHTVVKTQGMNAFAFFGGRVFGNNDTHLSIMDDLWLYDITGDFWVWLSGSPDSGNSSRIYYGERNNYTNPYGNNSLPGGRYGCQMWSVTDSEIAVFGGFGFSGYGRGVLGLLANLWFYHFDIRKWKWVMGSRSGARVVNVSDVYTF